MCMGSPDLTSERSLSWQEDYKLRCKEVGGEYHPASRGHRTGYSWFWRHRSPSVSREELYFFHAFFNRNEGLNHAMGCCEEMLSHESPQEAFMAQEANLHHLRNSIPSWSKWSLWARIKIPLHLYFQVLTALSAAEWWRVVLWLIHRAGADDFDNNCCILYLTYKSACFPNFQDCI